MIGDIIIWQFLGWKNFTPSKFGETGLQKMQNGEMFFREKHGKIAHGLNFAPKIIHAFDLIATKCVLLNNLVTIKS